MIFLNDDVFMFLEIVFILANSADPEEMPLNAQGNLRKCPDSSEPSLLAFIKYVCIQRLRPKFRPLAPLNMSATQHGRLKEALGHMQLESKSCMVAHMVKPVLSDHSKRRSKIGF